MNYQIRYIFKILLIIIISFADLFAQVGGLSATKLTLQSATVLSAGEFEFEPAFNVMNSKSWFGDNGNVADISGSSVASALDFRVTAGVAEGLEIGSSISSTIEEIIFGAKYLFYDNSQTSLALTGGVVLPAGNKFVADSLLSTENAFSFSIGPVFSLNLSERNSFDITLVYTTNLESNILPDVFYGGIGWGYMLRENLQLVMEVAGYACVDNKICSGKLSLFPGITYDITDSFSFAFGIQHDLLGKNEENHFGYFGAFTISFN